MNNVSSDPVVLNGTNFRDAAARSARRGFRALILASKRIYSAASSSHPSERLVN